MTEQEDPKVCPACGAHEPETRFYDYFGGNTVKCGACGYKDRSEVFGPIKLKMFEIKKRFSPKREVVRSHTEVRRAIALFEAGDPASVSMQLHIFDELMKRGVDLPCQITNHRDTIIVTYGILGAFRVEFAATGLQVSIDMVSRLRCPHDKPTYAERATGRGDTVEQVMAEVYAELASGARWVGHELKLKTSEEDA